MTYTSGSTFYDSVDADYDGDITTAIDAQTVDNKFHDELAMDVVPGTTLKVSSSEVHHVYLYQMESQANQNAAANGNGADIDPKDGCTGTAANDMHLVVEYKGAFSKPQSLCASAGTYATPTGSDKIDGKVTTDIPALKGLSIAITAAASGGGTGTTGITHNANLDTVFNGHFAWGATHDGSARVVISFTLPSGADGDSFK